MSVLHSNTTPLIGQTGWEAAHTIQNGTVTEAMLSTADNTTGNVSTSKHGFVPKAPNVATQYLDGTGAYSTPTPTALNPGVFAEIASPSTPSANTVAVYAKADGRIYSKDDGGTEYGPFSAAGAALYAIDETFPGSSLPAGWTFTGSGSATVSGGKVAVSCTAQSDRLMFAHTFSTGNHILRMHIKNYSATRGGMVGLSVFDASGNGMGMSPYNDGNTYFWKAATTGYQYSATNTVFGVSPSLTDIWWEMMVTGGKVVGGGYSTDGGVTWVGFQTTSPVAYTFTQVGICRLFTSSNESMDLYELTCTQP